MPTGRGMSNKVLQICTDCASSMEEGKEYCLLLWCTEWRSIAVKRIGWLRGHSMWSDTKHESCLISDHMESCLISDHIESCLIPDHMESCLISDHMESCLISDHMESCLISDHMEWLCSHLIFMMHAAQPSSWREDYGAGERCMLAHSLISCFNNMINL